MIVVAAGSWCCLAVSGRERDLPQAGECFGQGECPGAVLGQAQEQLALAVGDPGGDVQQPVAQRLAGVPQFVSTR